MEPQYEVSEVTLCVVRMCLLMYDVQTCLAYEFMPSETFGSRSFGFTVLVNYKDTVGVCVCVCPSACLSVSVDESICLSI